MAIKAVFFDLGDTLVTRKKWVPGARQLISDLRDKGVQVGIISNTGDLLREDLQKDYLPDDFDFEWFQSEIVLLSSEVGVEEPSLSIFNMAINHAGCAMTSGRITPSAMTSSNAAAGSWRNRSLTSGWLMNPGASGSGTAGPS